MTQPKVSKSCVSGRRLVDYISLALIFQEMLSATCVVTLWKILTILFTPNNFFLTFNLKINIVRDLMCFNVISQFFHRKIDCLNNDTQRMIKTQYTYQYDGYLYSFQTHPQNVRSTILGNCN